MCACVMEEGAVAEYLSPISLSARSKEIRPIFFFSPVDKVATPALRISFALIERLVKLVLSISAHPISTAEN